ncbi:MAG: hypothetical protein IH948_05000 [Bacteroidetes bacterium]|nr:hypothetical protein [Bacteroidota bacterium]
MNWGIKWAVVFGLAIIIAVPACQKCDNGKAKILVAVYQLNVADSTLITDAVVRVKCGTCEDPGTDGDYDYFDTTDYTGKVEFNDLKRRKFFFYVTAEVSTGVLDTINGIINWDNDTINWGTLVNGVITWGNLPKNGMIDTVKLYKNDITLYEKVKLLRENPDTTALTPKESISMKLYVDDLYYKKIISGTNCLEITNRQGETTLGVVLCDAGKNNCVAKE